MLYCSNYHNAFAYLIDAMIRPTLFLYVNILAIFMAYVVSSIKHSPKLKADLECFRPKVEIRHTSQQDFATQNR